MLDLESELNAEQLDAVRHTAGPLLVLAGAGSGKTRVITYKIAHLVLDRGIRPWQILAVTFTNKAAREMRERAERLLGAEAGEVWLGTFHSIGLRILRKHADLVGRSQGFVIYDEDDRERLLKRVIAQLNIDKDVLNVRAVRAWIDSARHELRGPDHAALPREGFIQGLCAKVYSAYEKAKQDANAMDFSDLIFRTVKLFEKHEPVLSEYRYRWRYLLVDEFQDTDHAQYRLLELLAGDDPRLCVVGDDDQSIYRWRGADVGNILGFPKDYAAHDVHVVRLEQNYRSTGNILAAASALIRHNSERHEKTLRTEKTAGEKLLCYQAESESGEARWVIRNALKRFRDGIGLDEIAIFYRTHSQSRVFEDALRANNIPYAVVGGLKFYERKEVKDVLSYLRLVQNPRDTIAMLRVVNTPTRGIGGKTLERAQDLASRRSVSLYEGLLLLASEPQGSRARRAIERFGKIVAKLVEVAEREKDAFRVAEAVLEETGYLSRLQDEGTFESETRAENVQELLVSIEDWRKRGTDRSLSAFLDHVSLLTSLDEGDAADETLTLMTVHAAKGLEFDTVFVTGLEEDVFPHFNSKEPEALEEERRLAYVAITRGKERVSLSWARSRRRFGRVDMNPPSRFLAEIPQGVTTFESEMGRRSPLGSASAGSPRRTWANAGSGWSPPPQAPQEPPERGSRGGWAQARETEGPVLDYSDGQLDSDFGGGLEGRRVGHPRFGEGQVVRVEGTGPQARVSVEFRSVGIKKIVARFLELLE